MTAKPDQSIRSFSVQNFGCLKDVSLDFEPFTVLVGPNDSGKTMIFRAFEALGAASSQPNGWGDVYPTAKLFKEMTFGHWGGGFKFSLTGDVSAQEYRYSVALNCPLNVEIASEELTLFSDKQEVFSSRRDGSHSWSIHSKTQGLDTTVFRQPHLPILHQQMLLTAQQNFRELVPLETMSDLQRALASLRRISFVPDRLRTKVPTKHDAHIGPDGFGLGRVYAELALRRRDAREEVESALRRAFRHIKRVDVDPGANHYTLEFVTKESFHIPAERVSDGVLLVFAYLLLSLGGAPSEVLLIEEPETGIHPGLMSHVVDSLRKLAHGELGDRPVQVIAATQSPILLNYVEPSEIRVLRRGEEGATQVSDFKDTPELAELLEYQSPGEIWVNLGEDYIAGSRHE